MKIRDKLQSVGIQVPDSAHSYRTGKGCLMWLPAATDDGSAAMCLIAVNAEQYESLMVAGLVGPCDWKFDDAYVDPTERWQHQRRG